jgi:ATP phosphoribosyltransferase
MGTDAIPEEAAQTEASDLPVVDGSATSAEELRAKVEEQSDERRQRVDQLREEVGATVEELAARLNVPRRVRARTDATLAAVQARTREAMVAARRQAVQVWSQSAHLARALREPRIAAAAALAAVLLVVITRRRFAGGTDH